MGDDFSDILGSGTLPVRQKSQSSSFSLPVKITSTLTLLLVGYIIAARAWGRVLKWREKSYRLSLRRRHGIPDNDHRPFNVAYAAVQRAKEQREKENTRIRRADLVAVAAVSSREPANVPPEQIRHRSGNQRGVDSSRSGAPVGGPPGRYNPMSTNNYLSMPSVPQSQPNHVTFADGFNTSASPLDVHAELASPTKRSGRKSLGILKSNDDRRKRERGFDDEDGDIAKKTRLEGDEFIDGDEEAVWQGSSDLLNSSESRVLKRGVGDDNDGDFGTLKGANGKRQRKVSTDKESPRRHDMDLDVEDYLGDLRSLSRGKKRDRDETGSSYGGEIEQADDDADVDAEEEKDRRRKRRNKRRSDANSSSRGKKRDRDLEDELGDGEDEAGLVSQRKLRKKRGKKMSDDEKASDVSMEDSSSIKGRKIGETWTSNGVQYKIGPNGQRLRFELVKKARQKFVMPMDSVHPDRRANLEVYVEAWLTEEEYRIAKARNILSWQESPNGSTEPETPPPTTPDISPAPPRTGKHLLWDSTTSTSSSQPHDNPFETPKSASQQLASTISGAASKRIASAVRSTSGGSKPLSSSNIAPPSPSLMDSTNMRSPRTYKQFSKWEKQDLEAKAMMRMREANRKKEEEKETLPSVPPAVPKITFTPAADGGSTAKPPPPAFSLPGASPAPKSIFNAPTTSSPLASGDNEAEAVKPPASTMPLFPFSKPTPAPQPATSPASTQASVPTSTPQVNGSANIIPAAPAKPSSFSFGPPAGGSHAASADKPKPIVGLGFPSLGPSASAAPQPAGSSATSASSTASLSSTLAPPKFSFNMPNPASSTNTEHKPDTPASNAASPGGVSLLSRLGATSAPGQNNVTSSTTPSPFSFSPSPAPAVSSTATSSSPFGGGFSAAPLSSPFGGAPSAPAATTAPQQPSQPTNAGSSSSAAAAAPVKFNFFGGANKTSSPFGNSNSNTLNTIAPTTSATPSSLSGALNPLPASSANTAKPTSSPFGSTDKKPAEEKSTTSAPTFSFGTPASSSAGATNGGNIFGAVKAASTSNTTSSTNPSPFGSGFGGNSAFSSGTFGSNVNSKSAFGSTATGPSKFGSLATPSPLNVAPTENNNVLQSGSGAFGAKSTDSDTATTPASMSVFSKPSEAPNTGPAAAAPKSAFSFGSSGTQNSGSTPAPKSAFSFGSSGTQNSDSTPAPKSAFSFGTSATQNPGSVPPPKSAFSFGSSAPSSSSGSTSFGFGGQNTFGASAAAKPAGEAQTKSAFSFGSPSSAPPATANVTPAGDPPKSAFSFGNNSTTPAGSPAKSAFSFGSTAATSGATGGAFGMPASGQSTPSVFGGASTPNPFSALANKPAGSGTVQ
ncbi:MAG: hypothetical protein NXY57DRAFT_961077 [Lentinula lateritia]|uniref:RanBD1 domain-containing protein n=1 Tax=Lentinula lateritia TaxID=40482 RepID=A0ABQ8V8W2_9AGAR|nr:MAG: hypothetical protein NXY57DRAFT_961077 [Lentinula lateritia]KAJ4471655.1 hypothetical protein C8R41DRAFT_870562 [Lentinula lateritia]